jgi:hypothetical protein
MAVVTQVSVFPSYAMQDKFVLTFPPVQYLVTTKTEAAFTCETLEETYYPLRRNYPQDYHLGLGTLGNCRGCDPSSDH